MIDIVCKIKFNIIYRMSSDLIRAPEPRIRNLFFIYFPPTTTQRILESVIILVFVIYNIIIKTLFFLWK